jgi:DNA mismatch repair ATPase MutL
MQAESINITKEEIVLGNISQLNQTYQLKYYPKHENLCDKVALYLYLKPKNEDATVRYAKRSIYFSELLQFREFIRDCVKAYFHWLDKRINPIIPKHEYNKQMLQGLLMDIASTMKDEWSKTPNP